MKLAFGIDTLVSQIRYTFVSHHHRSDNLLMPSTSYRANEA